MTVLAPPEAARQLIDDATGALIASGVARGRIRFGAFVPGRIEVLGKHTDYAGGLSLTAALERGIGVVAAPRDDDRVVVTDSHTGETVSFRMDVSLESSAGWPTYPTTVARRIARNFPGCCTGADIAFASNLPAAAGLSSSSALVIGVFLALAETNRLSENGTFAATLPDTEKLAAYCSCIENGQDYGALRGDIGVGTTGGSQDHVAILCARPDHLVLYRYAPVCFQSAIPMVDGYVFAVACSGVVAEKTRGALRAYNRAAELSRIAAARWRDATGRADATIGAALQSGPHARGVLLEELRRTRDSRASAEELVERAEQFIAESEEIVPSAAAALASGNLEAFGKLAGRSQGLASTHLHNQVPETAFLAGSARSLGAAAASAFGAGFGGSVWALVPSAFGTQFLQTWRTDYVARFPERAGACEFFVTPAAAPAVRVF